ncbi:DUF4405 domain-containing protein [Paenibacillus puldeungensis]|uniref:DUF4405 domain-containing protein n=1 Tax=Paenibacillus puldeungensis TaxID=696536 RepID=A0ABW3S3L5_9BACL
MNKKKLPYVKLILDILMGTTFALLFNKMVLGGLTFHEIAGTAIGFAVLAHVLLNVNYVKKITLRLFDKSLPGKTRLGYALNVLLLLSMIFILFSGFVISRVLFPNFQFGNERWFKVSHMAVSYFTLVLIGIHIGLHWSWVINVVKKGLHFNMSKVRSKVIWTSAAIVVLLFGGYQIYTTQFLSKLQMVEGMFSSSSIQAGHEEGSRPGFGQKPSKPQGMEPRGEKFQGGDFHGEGARGGHTSASAANVLLENFGVMAVFAGATYYLDKWLLLRRKRGTRVSIAS